MFFVFNKDKILSYLVSIGTVTLLFVMSFTITKKNDEILRASTNAILRNNLEENITCKNQLNYDNRTFE